MFAYCANNPTNCSDPSGMFWAEIWEEFVKLLEQSSPYFAAAAGVSQADTVVIGPGDLIAGAIVVGVVTVCAGVAIYNTVSVLTESDSIFQSDQEDFADDLGSIASSYGNYRCKEAAKQMQEYLEKNGEHGAVITISYIGGRDYIWSDIKATTISTNGIHVGIEYNGFVYCNVHPFGLPEDMWISDFQGTGRKTVTRMFF